MHQEQNIAQQPEIHTIQELTTRYTKPRSEILGNAQMTPTDHQEYADDAVLLLETTHNQKR